MIPGGSYKNGTECILITRRHAVQLPSLESDHEETDMRLLLYAHLAPSDHAQVTVQSPDTDVVVICVHMYSTIMCPKLWFRAGVRRYIPINDIVSAIGPYLCKILPALYALTGCDSTCALSGIGK